jgi:hypothetical protein
MSFVPSHYSGMNDSEYFQSQGGAVAETERAYQSQGEQEFRTPVLMARALARFASDRSLPFPLPVEWHKRVSYDARDIWGKPQARSLSVGEQYLMLKAALGLKDKTQAEVRKTLLDYTKKWPSPKHASEAYNQALGIEGLVDLREKITDAKETKDSIMRYAKLLLTAFAPGVGVLVLDRISKVLDKGAKLTLGVVDDNKAKAEVEYAKARTAHEADVTAMRQREAERKRKADEEKKKEEERKKQAEAQARRWLYGLGAAVGLTLLWALRGGKS